MPDTPYTQHRHYQFRGPTHSDSENKRIEENYLDFVSMLNMYRVLGEEYDEGYGRLLKEFISLSRQLEELEARQDILEADTTSLTFHSPTQVDTDLFDGTPYEIGDTVACTHDIKHGVVTLPEVVSSSISKFAFINSDNSVLVPSTLEARIEGEPGTADSVGATIDSNEPEQAVARQTGRIWERNVIVNAPDDSAQMDVFFKAPTDLFTTDWANAIVLHPYPVMGVDILDVSYTTNPNVLMDTGDGYTTLNDLGIHSGDDAAVGWTPPGGWVGDEDINAGPRVYHFSPKRITGIKVTLRQRHYFKEGGVYVYSYGLSAIDLRQNKFLDEGKAMIRFDAPEGQTISEITNVLPQMWNVAEADYPLVFSYRPIWETAFQSGVYTTSAVPFSNRVWLEVTLSAMPNGGTPALSGLTVQFE